MQSFLCILHSLRDRGIIKWEFNVSETECVRLVDERSVPKDGARISRSAGPAIGGNFLVAHGVVERVGNFGREKALNSVLDSVG